MDLYIFQSKLTKKFGLKDSSTDKTIIMPFYDEITEAGCKMFRLKKGNLYGAVDEMSGKLTIPVKYENLTFNEDRTIKANNSNLTRQGENVPAKDMDLVAFKDDLGRFGFIDKNTNKVIITPTFHKVFPEDSDGMICVEKIFCHESRYGAINGKNGELMVRPIYEEPIKFNEGFAIVDNKVISKEGKFVFGGLQYNFTGEVSNGLVCEYNRSSHKSCYFDLNGKVVIDDVNYGTPFTEFGFAHFEDKDKRERLLFKNGESVLVPDDFARDHYREPDFEKRLAQSVFSADPKLFYNLVGVTPGFENTYNIVKPYLEGCCKLYLNTDREAVRESTIAYYDKLFKIIEDAKIKHAKALAETSRKSTSMKDSGKDKIDENQMEM